MENVLTQPGKAASIQSQCTKKRDQLMMSQDYLLQNMYSQSLGR